MLDCINFQCDIDVIVASCVAWQLTLNVSKCLSIRYILVDKPLLDYYMSGALLKRVVTTNDLGVMFDTKLSFSIRIAIMWQIRVACVLICY